MRRKINSFRLKKVVSFNRQLIKNDGLLANYIAEVQDVSYNTANNIIREFVYELESSLQKENHVELTKIGKFYLDAEDKLQFEPQTEINFLTQSFGLSSFHTEKNSA